MRLVSFSILGVVVLCLALTEGCSKSGSGSGGSLPLLTPIVKSAAPKAFGGTNTGTGVIFSSASLARDFFAVRDNIDPSDFATRFFQSGPTDIYSILGNIDSRIGGINGTSTTEACASQTPVSYNLTTWGTTVPMYAQCYQTVGTNGLVMWGVKSGVTYLWVQVGAGDLAAIATPITGTSNYTVQAWGTVGNAGTYNSNGTTAANFDTIGSYGVMQLTANQSAHTFEMVAAGLGLGYCGAHFISDGTDIYGEGSVDMGATCNTDNPLCVSAADGTTVVSGTCSVTNSSFALTSIGRTLTTSPDPTTLQMPEPSGYTYGASAYPGSSANNITLNGSATDALAIGPTTPPTGVGQFQ